MSCNPPVPLLISAITLFQFDATKILEMLRSRPRDDASQHAIASRVLGPSCLMLLVLMISYTSRWVSTYSRWWAARGCPRGTPFTRIFGTPCGGGSHPISTCACWTCLLVVGVGLQTSTSRIYLRIKIWVDKRLWKIRSCSAFLLECHIAHRVLSMRLKNHLVASGSWVFNKTSYRSWSSSAQTHLDTLHSSKKCRHRVINSAQSTTTNSRYLLVMEYDSCQ